MSEIRRIYDHCFVPQKDDQLRDECAFGECSRSEIEHEWTVEAYRCNPDMDPQEGAVKIRRYDSPGMVQTDCQTCGAFLCVTAGAYTGVVTCPKCGSPHVFNNSLSPVPGAAPGREKEGS